MTEKEANRLTELSDEFEERLTKNIIDKVSKKIDEATERNKSPSLLQTYCTGIVTGLTSAVVFQVLYLMIVNT